MKDEDEKNGEGLNTVVDEPWAYEENGCQETLRDVDCFVSEMEVLLVRVYRKFVVH